MNIFAGQHPFYSFILSLLIFLFGITVFILGLFIAIELFTKIFSKIKFREIKDTVERNPYIGQQDQDGNFFYKQGRFTLKYRICPEINEANKRIEVISVKTKPWPFQEKLIKFKRDISNHLIYHEWIYLFRLSVFFLLLIPILIFYSFLIEPQTHKDYRLKWIVSCLSRVDPEYVEINPGGWVRIWGSRRTAVDHQHEPISYNFNPFKWLTFQDEGYVERWRGGHYGYAVHAIKYRDYGNLLLSKDGRWIEGRVSKDVINWETPQGTGIRSGKVLSHDLRLSRELSSDDE